MRWRNCWSLAVLLGFAAAAWAGAGEPAKPAAKVRPYNEKADARADLEAALRRARKDNRRVLIQWGGNWCIWCVLLHERFTTDPGLRRKLLYEYEYLPIDIGHRDKNLDLARRYHADLGQGVPYLTVLDADGKVLANQRTDPFETTDKNGKKGHDPQKLLAFLTEHQARPWLAEEVLRAGLERAAKSDRLVFLHFGAPWCGWCRRLEAWMARPDVGAVLGKDFVDVKIDIDRMPGGKAVLTRYNPKAAGGIPWFVFLDAQGKALATSDSPQGNIGFPSADPEIKHFLKMLKTAKRRLTQDDLEQLRASLEAERKPASR